MTRSNRRKLYRSKNDKIIAGIFGGLGEYFDIDVNLLRVIALFLIFLTFFGGLIPFLIIYFIAMFIIPSEREKNKEECEDENNSCVSIYKKWLFWLIIVIIFFPIILMILGFFLFSVRTDVINVRENRVIIEYPRDN